MGVPAAIAQSVVVERRWIDEVLRVKLAVGAARADEDDLVLAVVIDVGQVRLPSPGFRLGERVALDAHKGGSRDDPPPSIV